MASGLRFPEWLENTCTKGREIYQRDAERMSR